MCAFHFRAQPRDWLPTRLVFGFSYTFWTLAPCDHITYYQARGLSGHTSPCFECVFSNLEDSVPPEVEDDYLPYSWSDSKWAHLVHSGKFFDFELELLTSFWLSLLGILCSTMVHNCSVTHYGGQTMSLTARLCSHLLGQAQYGVA